MSKELIKEAIGLSPGHEYDMRPRYDADTYIEILNWAKRTGINPNVLLRIMTKMALKELNEQSQDRARHVILQLSGNNWRA